ncbi:hypothetical protein [Chamaesiphon sp. OTE_8_metabat_110]|nr:hypothetical protein [Chamaesiphon sp. OTE_8_metabat_110]
MTKSILTRSAIVLSRFNTYHQSQQVDLDILDFLRKLTTFHHKAYK